MKVGDSVRHARGVTPGTVKAIDRLDSEWPIAFVVWSDGHANGWCFMAHLAVAE